MKNDFHIYTQNETMKTNRHPYSAARQNVHIASVKNIQGCVQLNLIMVYSQQTRRRATSLERYLSLAANINCSS